MFFRFGRRKNVLADIQTQHRQAEDALAARDHASAEQLFRAMLEQAPQYAAAWFGCCQVLVEQERFADARELLLRGVQALPQDAGLHSHLGNLHFHEGDVVAAVLSCERALALRPGDLATMANLANFLLVQGNAQRASEIAARALAIEPGMHDVRRILAQACERLERLDEAATHYVAGLQAGVQAAGLAEWTAELLIRLGRFDDAVTLISVCRLEVAQAAAIHVNIGVARHGKGDPAGAIAAFRTALTIDARHAPALTSLGLVLHEVGQDEEALRHLQTAIDIAPDDAAAHLTLGSVLGARGKNEAAIAAFRRAVALAPDRIEAHCNLAITLFNVRHLEEALESAVQALEIDRQHVATLDILGDILWALGRGDEAGQHFKALLDLAPGMGAVHDKLGRVRLEQHAPDEALRHFDVAAQLDPGNTHAPVQAASLRMRAGEFNLAAQQLGQFLARHPEHAGAHTLLGSAQAELNRFDEARASYARALAIKPDYIDALASRGLLDLLLGDFAAGWEGYRHLTRQTGMVPLPEFGSPLWQNDADLNGKSLLLYAEQGMGDAMQFVRYVEQLSRFDCRITLAVQSALRPLMEGLPWPVSVVSKNEALPATDYHCPLGLLPRAFATRLESIPAPVPYLFAPPERQAWWRERLDGHRGPRVGLVWAGNPLFSGDRDRSVPLELIESLFQHPRCHFHALQKEPRPGEAERTAMFDRVTNLGPDLQDFAETAAIIANLDLVLTVDTSVAHLAGAMGKPVWIMLPFSPDFRWLLGRSDSPWYPHARLFRQETAGDWAGVAAQVHKALFTEY